MGRKKTAASDDAVTNTLTSDEGIPITQEDADHIANLSTDIIDSKRRELRFGCNAYHHVGENALGQWTYRSDK